jgi:hypothetical protein
LALRREAPLTQIKAALRRRDHSEKNRGDAMTTNELFFLTLA